MFLTKDGVENHCHIRKPFSNLHCLIFQSPCLFLFVYASNLATLWFIIESDSFMHCLSIQTMQQPTYEFQLVLHTYVQTLTCFFENCTSFLVHEKW